ncbi:hypothetical protein QBC37DRAFT_299595, partial [Rhypophila decipiens]
MTQELRALARTGSVPPGGSAAGGAAPSTSTTTNSKSVKQADPPIFYNQKDKDTVVFEYFRRMLLNKLDNNTDHFPTERMKCGYIESRLGGKAAEDLLPYLDDTHPDRLDTVDKLIKHLTEQYGNANALADAKDEFADLK